MLISTHRKEVVKNRDKKQRERTKERNKEKKRKNNLKIP